MNLGFETIGNATLIVYDEIPLLVTDPWIQGSAYFGSWGLSHEIPDAQRKAILECPYVWISHGHPDHLNPESIPLFKDKKILIADHFGSRMKRELLESGYDVTVLPNKKWIPLSEKIQILTLADPGQDSILLINIDGTLIVNTNDCGENGWGYFLRKEIAKFETSFLLRLLSYGDADMIHLYDESGKLICPDLTSEPIGEKIQPVAEWLGVTHVVPFSSQHCYQRTDSQWANRFLVKNPDEFRKGFNSNRCILCEPFLSYEVNEKKAVSLEPKPRLPFICQNEDWSVPLSGEDKTLIRSYFSKFSALFAYLGFVRFIVGGIAYALPFSSSLKRGVTFETPRDSLIEAVKYEVFEDLLIGNFTKTTLHGDWSNGDLNQWFTPWVAKYGDNGRAYTKSELKAYFSHYEKICPAFRLMNYEKNFKNTLRPWLTPYPHLFRALKKMKSYAPHPFSPH